MKNKEKVLILDGYNLFYRARYSGMNKGEYSTIFNFFRSLKPIIEKFSPEKVDLVLEGMPKKRLEILSEYKGQRTYHNKDNFSEQRKNIIHILKNYFPINLIRHPDYECDDIIGYLSKLYENENKEVIIISSDTDFIQSINENIKLYNPVKKEFIERKEYDYVKWKALVGDKADNISGFKGVGNKTAKKIISSNESLEEFLNIEGNRDKFNLNVNLIKFHDIIENNDYQKLEYYDVIKKQDWDGLKNIFNEMSFNSIIGKEKSWNNYTNAFNNLFKEK